MGYEALTDAEIAQDKFVTTNLMDKIKGNFDYLYSQSGGGALPPNGSFETDTDENEIPDNWTRSLYPGGSGGLYTSAPAHGAKSVYFTHPGGSGNGGGYLDSGYIEVSQLQSLSLFYILWASAAGMKIQVYIRYYDKAQAYLSQVALYNSTSNPTSAALYCSQFVPPSNARYIKIRLIGGYTDTDVAGTAYFDGLWLVPTVVTDSVKDASITEAKLGTGAVTETKVGALAITGAKTKKASAATGQWNIGASTSYTPAAGVYMFAQNNSAIRLQLYIGSNWYGDYAVTGLCNMDGSTRRLRNWDEMDDYYCYYHTL